MHAVRGRLYRALLLSSSRPLPLPSSSVVALAQGSPESPWNVAQDVPARLNKSDLHALNLSAESNLSFKALVTTNETNDSEASNTHQGREPAINWGSTNSPYLSSGLDDPNSSYPYLLSVLEEPSSSFSEAADDDPVPAIEGLQISGDAFPGRELQACGYSINGAKQPKYLVTADDVDSYLAIEVHPLDDRKRKGEKIPVSTIQWIRSRGILFKFQLHK
ncbi:hypothetical protein KSP40_PGU020960 [Platanthera guangdongensis]|uniref:Uncharacterized protein n=1 Tax=Platanthera guangdongensis TaxID=2320717 RepID=A0ABR2MY42_9ASPA